MAIFLPLKSLVLFPNGHFNVKRRSPVESGTLRRVRKVVQRDRYRPTATGEAEQVLRRETKIAVSNLDTFTFLRRILLDMRKLGRRIILRIRVGIVCVSGSRG